MSNRAALTTREKDAAMSADHDPFSRQSVDELADAAEAADEADLLDVDGDEADDAPINQSAGFAWGRALVAALPVVALILALGVGYLKWLDGKERESHIAAEESMKAATQSTIAILSYKPETVDQDLTSAGDRLTAGFRQQYTQLVTDVVAPGAKQQHITAVATVAAAASVTATGKQAVVLVFVDQTTIVGNDPPTQSTSSVRVTLDKIDGRWLISQFDPV